VISVTLDGGAPIFKDSAVYTFATNDFVNGGGDSYEMLKDGQGIVRELLMQVVADWIEALSPATPGIAGRITVVP
jgi:2',3'-cyclic-nucleotide 2'-phosphodiesterase (5'-nucleotidase family)